MLLSLQILFNAKVGRKDRREDRLKGSLFPGPDGVYCISNAPKHRRFTGKMKLYFGVRSFSTLVVTLSVLKILVSVSGGLRPTSAPILPFFLRILMTRKG